MAWTLITGGAKGIGAGICKGLAQRGYHPLIHYNTGKTEAEKLAKECESFGVKAEVIQGDFSSRESTQNFIDACLNQYPEVCNLINNVGNVLYRSTLETATDEWHALFQPNLHAPFELCKAYSPSLKRARGSIINLGIAGIDTLKLATIASAYMITKTGLLMLTRFLAKELAPDHVRVNMVSPGIIENSKDLPSFISLPMERKGTIEEVVNVIAFLLDPQNNYITGQNIEIAGGIGL